ncbi:hypothetical protein EC957_011536 [Mortierella hygrophila]|uniref:F-box domain-containing protein n=1 Tax=Mortierella hygrophila TaxID=979708 RepID=A0A9P6F8Q6_9FUNG|nr:hypothetical protein EC957_011536 [Mortierella hygrophila]
MSVFEIPELARLIAPYLRPHDLTRCVRVSKTWHTYYIPILWRFVPPTSSEDIDERDDLELASLAEVALRPLRCWEAFRRIVVKDYQYSLRHGDDGEAEGESSLPTLSRYGHWIRKLNTSQVNLSRLPAKFAQYNLFNNRSNSSSSSSSSTRSYDDPFAMFGLNRHGGPSSMDGNVLSQVMAMAMTEVDPDLMSLLPAGLLDDRLVRPRHFSRKATNVRAAPEPSGKELLLHLLKRCPNLQSLELVNWDDYDVEEDRAFWKAIATDVVPRLQELNVNVRDVTHHTRSSPYTAPLLFAHCSSKMQTFKLQLFAYPSSASSPIRRARQSKGKNVEVPDPEPEMDDSPLTGMKELSVVSKYDAPYPPSWLRFLTRCVNLERLEVTKIFPTWYGTLRGCVNLRSLAVHDVSTACVQFIADALRNSFLHLDEIEIMQDFGDLKEGAVADMISACRAGWKLVNIPTLDTAAAEALVNHCPTLERLEFRRSASLTSLQMHQILSTSPRLTTFVTMRDSSHDFERDWFVSAVAKFAVQDFIDIDPNTKALKPWACESTLKDFAAKITGIPRPDITQTFHGHPRQGGLQETHPGQSQELQRRVYERLARFTHLEELELGHDDRDWDNEENYIDDAEGDLVYNDVDFQYECVDLTLKNGLGLLEGLKELKTISFMRMATRVGTEEVKWMVESWPQLEYISGLDVLHTEEKAGVWLEKKHPNIAVVPYTVDG